MSEMTENQTAKIRKGLSARRDPACVRVDEDVIIPAGTVLRSIGDGKFSARVGFSTPGGRGMFGDFVIETKPGEPLAAGFRKVIA